MSVGFQSTCRDFQTGVLGSAVAALDNGDLPFSTNADTINALTAATVLCPQRVPETLEAHAAFRSCCKYPLSLYSELQRKTCVCCRVFVGRAGCLDSDECPQLRGGADRIWRQWSWPRFARALPALRPGASHVMDESATGAGHLHPPAPTDVEPWVTLPTPGLSFLFCKMGAAIPINRDTEGHRCHRKPGLLAGHPRGSPRRLGCCHTSHLGQNPSPALTPQG